ncbi:MAG: hypothetical protein LAN61_06185 [Acidobacteriia bacterium]|nr:hypothetical protein [Terriglobia bacterium]
MEHWDWLILTILLAGAWLAPNLGQRWFRPIEAAFSRLAARRTFVVVLIFFAAIVLRLSLLPVIPVPVPGIHDEFAYLLQADTFAHGRLANPPHPLWLSFETFHVNWFPTYSGMFPPAQSFVLAVGQLLGHPWIGVLLSTAAMLAAITWMLQGWLPARWALLGGVIALLKLGLISYWMNSYWGGSVAAGAGALVLGALVRIQRQARLRDAMLLGLGVAVLANSRPMEGLIFSLPAAVTILFWLWRSSLVPRRVKFQRVLAPVAIILVLTGAFILYYDWRLTGNPLLMPHLWNWRRTVNTALFVWQKNGPPFHFRNRQLDFYYNVWVRAHYTRSWDAAIRVWGETIDNCSATFLWAGAFPLWFCIPLVFRDRRMRLLLATLLLSSAALFAVAWSLPHYAAPAVCVLYAVLLQSLRHLRTMRFAGRRVGIGLSRLIILLLLFTVGLGFYHRMEYPYAWNWNGNMGNWRRAAVSAMLQRMPGKQLAVVRYGRLHNIHEEWVYNGADIDGSKVVWARELDDRQNQKLLAYFHDRQAWLVQPEDAPGKLTPYTPAQATAAAAPKP